MENKKNDNEAQERGFNSMASYGDPKDNTDEPQETAPQKNQSDLAGGAADGENASNAAGETGTGIYTGQKVDDLASPDANLTDNAETGRNRGNVPMMDRQIDDVPANDPNAGDAGPVKTADDGGNNVRQTDSVMEDLSDIDVSEEGLPANNQAASEVPPADPAINDVPDADRSLSDSTEHLAQNAADRTRRDNSGK